MVCLSNTSLAGDEHTALTQEKIVWLEERKKVRNRISMKEKLAEKKAEIAGRNKKSHEAEITKKPLGMEVDD